MNRRTIDSIETLNITTARVRGGERKLIMSIVFVYCREAKDAKNAHDKTGRL